MQEERERANVPIEYGDVIVRISTPDSGEYETIKIADMQSEVANVLYAIPFWKKMSGMEMCWIICRREVLSLCRL